MTIGGCGSERAPSFISSLEMRKANPEALGQSAGFENQRQAQDEEHCSSC